MVIIVIIYWYNLDNIKSAAKLYMVLIVMGIVTMVIDVCCVLEVIVLEVIVLVFNVM